MYTRMITKRFQVYCTFLMKDDYYVDHSNGTSSYGYNMFISMMHDTLHL